jgi:hypothetical protein
MDSVVVWVVRVPRIHTKKKAVDGRGVDAVRERTGGSGTLMLPHII